MSPLEQLLYNSNMAAPGNSNFMFPQAFETDYYKNTVIPQQAQQLQPFMQPQAQPAQTQPVMNQNVQQQIGRLTGQASNALYGGLLGYQPQAMQGGGQSFAAPQGDFRSAFGGMQGLLGRM